MTLVTIISKDKAFLPLLFEMKEKVKTHILIYDIAKDEIEIALDTKKGLERLKEKYNLDYEIKLKPIDEDSKKSFQGLYDFLGKYNNLVLNVAEADSMLTIILSAFILKKSGRVLSYDKFDNTYNEIKPNSCELKKIINNMKLDDFMILNNYKIIEKKTAMNIVRYKKYVLKLFQNYKDFIKMKNRLKRGDKITPYYKKLFKKVGAINNEKINFHRLDGEIFEEFIFWNFYTLDIDDIWLNVKFVSEEFKEEIIKNEVDILMIKNNRIFFVECKLGRLNMKPDELIYKCDSLMSLFGEDTKGIIVNLNKLMSKSKNMNEFSKNLILRAKENNIYVYRDEKINTKTLNNFLKDVGLKRRAFLLGGCDLEMAAIERLLKKYNQIYFNKNLKWGAKLSEYEDVLKKDYCFYGIELIKDIEVNCYKEIDHHNEKSNLDSSIEQIADILGIKLSYFEKLIAANDKGYIPLMKKLNASDKDIQRIRKLDRKFQGVTKEDEIQAIEDIKKLQILKGIKVIKTKLTKFSPITDRLNGEIIVANDKEAVYYGDRVEELVSSLKTHNIYYGKGYLGIISPSALEILLSLI
jgi:hypothetical protein